MAAGSNKIGVTQGADIYLRTWERDPGTGVGLVDEQYMQIAEAVPAGYTAIARAVSIATANKHLLATWSGVTLKQRVRRIEIHPTTLSTAGLLTLQVIRLSTQSTTGGTAVTPSPLDPADAAAGTVAISLPTSLGTEQQVIAEGTLYLPSAVAASATNIAPLVFDFDRHRSKAFTCAVSAGYAIKNTSNLAGTAVTIVAYFDESAD